MTKGKLYFTPEGLNPEINLSNEKINPCIDESTLQINYYA